MIYRKIFANVVVSLLVPIAFLVRWWPNTYRAIVYQQYEYYDFDVRSLNEFLYLVYGQNYFPIMFASLICIFLPFQIIRDHYKKRGKPLSFVIKMYILSSMVLFIIALFGTFNYFWVWPWYHSFIYIGHALGFGLIFTTVLYFMVDRYEERGP